MKHGLTRICLSAGAACLTSAATFPQGAWHEMFQGPNGAMLINQSSIAGTGNTRTADVYLLSHDTAVIVKLEGDCSRGVYRFRAGDDIGEWNTDKPNVVHQICRKDLSDLPAASDSELTIAMLLAGGGCHWFPASGVGWGLPPSKESFSCEVLRALPDGTMVEASASLEDYDGPIAGIRETMYLKGSVVHGESWDKYKIDGAKLPDAYLEFSSSYKKVVHTSDTSQSTELVRQPLSFVAVNFPWASAGGEKLPATIRFHTAGWSRDVARCMETCSSSPAAPRLKAPNSYEQRFTDDDTAAIDAAFRARKPIKVEVLDSAGKLIEAAEFHPGDPAQQVRDELIKQASAKLQPLRTPH